MDRRIALKNLTLGLGYAIATPTILSILQSCTSETADWTPLFLSSGEKRVVIYLMDIIMPKTDTPGALDVNVPQFLDRMYKEIEDETSQKQFKSGAETFIAKYTAQFDKKIADAEKEEIETIFTPYFTISEEKTEEIKELLGKPVFEISREEGETYAMYKFLFSVRYYAIYGYCTSEKIGEEVLSYDPIPGEYRGCIPVEEVGNAWSL